jgi:hypothetical protein
MDLLDCGIAYEKVSHAIKSVESQYRTFVFFLLLGNFVSFLLV